jgi:NADPH dehydrogenase (quinone)
MELAKVFFLERGHQLAETFVERGYKWEAEEKKPARVRPGHPPDADELVRCTWIYKKYVDEVFNVGLTTKVLLEGMAGASRQYGTALENTARELVSQVNRAKRTGRLFSRQTVVFC